MESIMSLGPIVLGVLVVVGALVMVAMAGFVYIRENEVGVVIKRNLLEEC